MWAVTCSGPSVARRVVLSPEHLQQPSREENVSPPRIFPQTLLIEDKTTGESAYSPTTEEAGPMWHRKESEGEESEGEESEGEEVRAVMAAVRLE